MPNNIINQNNCWNTIGVWGNHDPKCDQLQHVIHCRNCDIFQQAGRAVFDRDIPEGDVKQWTSQIAKVEKEINKTDLSILTFRLGEHWFALPTLIFSQISQDGFSHKIPHKPDNYGLKLVNFGGTIYILVSLSVLLGIDIESKRFYLDAGNRLMLVSINGNSYVLPANEIGGVYRIDSKKIADIDEHKVALFKEIVRGIVTVGGESCILINEDSLSHVIENSLDSGYG